MIKRFAPVLRFLLAAYLDGMAIWIVAVAGGLGSGPAFVAAAALATGALKAWLLEPVAEFVGLERRPRRRFGPALEICLAIGAYAAVLAVSNIAGFALKSEPVGLALVIEGAYAALRFIAGLAWRGVMRLICRSGG
ncbi:MAG: hypothetical protein Q8M76_00025 [Spirochaetaceae bacterium]|nr:hypothetical protein [Spirochaetaceae bacterium]